MIVDNEDICRVCGGRYGLHAHNNKRCPKNIDASREHSEFRTTVFMPMPTESEYLKELLREFVMREHILFPETEQDLKWFDEGIVGQHDFFIKVSTALGLGEIDAEAFKKVEESYNKSIKENETNKKFSFRFPKG